MHKATDSYRKAVNLSSEEKRAMLAQILRERSAQPETLHELFESQAARDPEAIALTDGDRELSYEELNQRANRLARHLRELGAERGSLVAIYADRSTQLVVAILGTLKTGAAYVPLDPVYPPDRIAYMLADSQARILLTQRALADRLPEHEAFVVHIDDENRMSAASDQNPPGALSPNDLAYVIYTSGSTGRPKGVAVTHGNVVRLFRSTDAWFNFGPEDVWTLFHSIAFDFSVWEIWGALLHGGRVVVVPYWASRSPDAFLNLIHKEGVTVLNQTPSAFRQFAKADEESTIDDDLPLRLVIFGGEALELQSLRPWFARHGDQHPQLVNMYGITETTVHVTYRPVSADDLGGPPGSSPIGRPIPDLWLYLLDRHMQPVPAGVIGELYVGGAGLAQGYLGRAALTAERFVPDPFGPLGSRLYKSGDLARRRSDGDLDYVGRADQQVKIRGFRIELGEIEALLVNHPDVREAVVLAREDRPGDRRLAAYFVPQNGAVPSSSELRLWLKPRLPDYMVPAAFVPLETLPLTENGKIDRESLPPPGESANVAAECQPPRNPTEQIIAAVWAEVLVLDRVSVFDDFFALGGHSLLATQLASRLRNAFGIDVPLRALFESPTIAGQAETIEALRRSGGALDTPTIEPSPRDGAVPASFAQQALWFLDQLDPGRPTFNVSAAVRVQGDLDVDALDHAFSEIVRRHDVLRASFAAVDGELVQRTDSAPVARMEVLDLRNRDREKCTRQLERVAIESARRPFDLARGPLVRAIVVRLLENESAVLLTMHHIITDGWSFGVAAAELATLYEAFHAGLPSPLPDLRIQYADFARWQRAWLRGKTLEKLVAHWSTALANVPALELPTDRPRPAIRSARGGIRFFVIEPGLTTQIHSLARAEGATPFMVLLAAFQVLIHRYSGQTDFAVGSPIANRNRSETEGLIGYFVNMLAVRANLFGDPPFRALIARVRDASLAAYEHQDLPFESLVDALKLPRDPSRTPVFQVMFVLQNNRLPLVIREDLRLSSLLTDQGTGTAKFDLTLALEEEERGGMVGSFEFDADLFDDDTIERMIGHWQILLQGVVQRPGSRVSELPLLKTDELVAVLEAPNRTARALPTEPLAHRLFEAQAAAHPERVALQSGETALPYKELNQRANQLAHRLRKLGVRTDDRVAIAVERSCDLGIALLGILKAGAAFVPLDIAYPRERLALMLADCGARVLITQERLISALPDTSATVVSLNDVALFDHESSDNLDLAVDPHNAAYVIYTSGSTGAPRGALITHRGMVNHNLAAQRLFKLKPRDRVLQFSSLSFDIAVEELFPAWAAGATVVTRGGDETLEPLAFSRWVGERQITVLDLPTAYWHAWVRRLAATYETLPQSLRLVVVGGEKALPSVFAQWRAIGGDRVRWMNTYGPTEATVIATSFEPTGVAQRRAACQDLPIGRPIANTSVYLLDRNMYPVPLGLPGELYIGGTGVCRGYLGRPSETADRFRPDPFSARPGARLFRTGDIARWRRDGMIGFLGRADRQVKIRGFRVEPMEVETALVNLHGISAAAVIARKTDDGEYRLDAYVVPVEGGELNASLDDIKRSLRDILPRHMIPATLTALPALPLTPSGKVDRQGLTAPQPTQRETDVSRRPPRDEVEHQLVRVWEELLEIQGVGIDENFFDLGGHSMLAIRLLARIEEEFGRALPLSALFVGATIQDLAVRLREVEHTVTASPLVAIQDQGSGAPFFCVHPAGGIVYCFRDLARAMGADRPLIGIQSPGLEDDALLPATIEALAANYLAAITRAYPTGPYHLGGWSMGGLVAFEMARQLRERSETVATLAMLDAQAPKADRPKITAKLQALASEIAALDLLSDISDPNHDLTEDALVLAEFAGDLAFELGGSTRKLIEQLKTLPIDERRERLLYALKLHHVYHLEAGPEKVRRLWRVLRTNLLAAARYRPEPYDGRVMLFRAAKRRENLLAEKGMGWHRLATGGVTVFDIPGDHAGILKGSAVERLAKALRAEIAGSEDGS
jgi:amino acid adenylation domain-containing protein